MIYESSLPSPLGKREAHAPFVEWPHHAPMVVAPGDSALNRQGQPCLSDHDAHLFDSVHPLYSHTLRPGNAERHGIILRSWCDPGSLRSPSARTIRTPFNASMLPCCACSPDTWGEGPSCATRRASLRLARRRDATTSSQPPAMINNIGSCAAPAQHSVRAQRATHARNALCARNAPAIGSARPRGTNATTMARLRATSSSATDRRTIASHGQIRSHGYHTQTGPSHQYDVSRSAHTNFDQVRYSSNTEKNRSLRRAEKGDA